MSFDQFNLSEQVLNGLRDMGFDKPTPIQESCIPKILEGRDILASAQTGTGKTAAFAIPVLEKLLEKKKQKKEGIRTLVITPTRELAGQVDEAFFAIGYHTGITTAKVYGGDDWSRQEKALSQGTNIIVATPGRLLDHMKIHDVDFSQLDFLILDEADRMLDMGFIPDITQIVSSLPKKRQTLLFSATLPQKIVQLAKKMMHNPERISTAPSNKAAEGISQGMYYVEERDKLPLVLHLFEKEKWSSAIIFMSTKRAVDKLSRELIRKGASVTSIHGDRSQAEREKALESFRKGEYRIIVATDVMSRGIDVDGISHIINFSVPHDVEDYVHRIGRTARADAKGDALTLVSGQDRRYMENIIRAMDSEIKKLELPDFGGKSDRESGGKENKDETRSRSRDDRRDRSKNGRSGQKGRRGVDARKQSGSQTGQGGQNKAEKTPSKTDRSGAGRPKDKKKPGPRRKPHERKPAGVEKSETASHRDAAGQNDSGRVKGRQSRPKKGHSHQGRPRQGRPPRGRAGQRKDQKKSHSGTPAKPGANRRNKPSSKEMARKELFDNITSPDMERVNKAVEKKRGVWTKIKGLFGGD